MRHLKLRWWSRASNSE